MLRDKTPHKAFSLLVYIGCAIAFLTIPFGSSTGRNIFYLSSYVSFISFVFHFRYFTKNKLNLILPTSIFLVGVISILWTVTYKNPGDYVDLYRQYQSTGRLQIATAFILIIALNERLMMQKKTIVLGLVTGLAVNAYGLYQGLFDDTVRVELNFDRATVAAYIITSVSLIMMKSVLLLKTRFCIPLYLVLFIITYSTLVLTGTRASMLVYPVAVFLMIVLSSEVITLRHRITMILLVPFLLIVTSIVFKNKINIRINDIKENIQNMNKIDGENSVGARLSMEYVALHSGLKAPLGQSAESRARDIKNMVNITPRLYGALPYATVHLHNEVLENFSIKGFLGVLALLAFYGNLLFFSFRPFRNPALFSITVALITYGLSDVIFFSTEGTAVFCLAIIFSILLTNKKKMEKEIA